MLEGITLNLARKAKHDGMISEDVLDEIARRLTERVPSYDYNSRSYMWDIVGTDMRNDDGKLPKRVKRYVKKRYSYNMTPDDCGYVFSVSGDIVRFDGWCDITDKFDWDDGDFADGGSCFWDDRREARRIMEEEGFRALRLYDNDFLGVGRCWVYDGGDRMILFNAYLDQRYCPVANPLNMMADIMIQTYLPDRKRKAISLSCDGRWEGLLYINGGRGVIIADNVNDVESYDFELNIDYYTCTSCGDIYHADYMILQEGDLYCEGCFGEIFTYCEHCEEAVCRDDTKIVEGEEICERCYDNNTTSCGICGDTFFEDSLVDVDDYDVCPSCYAEAIITCDVCREDRYKGDMNEVDGANVCNYCMEAKDEEV